MQEFSSAADMDLAARSTKWDLKYLTILSYVNQYVHEYDYTPFPWADAEVPNRQSKIDEKKYLTSARTPHSKKWYKIA